MERKKRETEREREGHIINLESQGKRESCIKHFDKPIIILCIF